MNKSDAIRQLHLAMVLLTRLPLPHLPTFAFAQGAAAVWAYPLVGVIAGTIGVIAGHATLMLGLPVLVAGVIGVCAMMLLTGAMHEDGLADVADGFWGANTPERRLEIMRDSQIGTYGVLALIAVFTLRVSAFGMLLQIHWGAVVVAAVVSRAMMPLVMWHLPAARMDGLAHSVGAVTARTAMTGAGIALGVAVIGMGLSGLAALIVALLVTVGMATLAQRKIGGQTGDVLGATQQLCEVALLLTALALFA